MNASIIFESLSGIGECEHVVSINYFFLLVGTKETDRKTQQRNTLNNIKFSTESCPEYIAVLITHVFQF